MTKLSTSQKERAQELHKKCLVFDPHSDSQCEGNATELPTISRGMVARGYTDRDIKNVLRGSMIRLLGDVLPLLAGVLQEVIDACGIDRVVRGQEIRCRGKGETFCEFLVEPV
jgi:hypothetical protein